MGNSATGAIKEKIMKSPLNQIPLVKALNYVRSVEKPKSVKIVSLSDAAGCILAESLYAKYSVPSAPLSAMDGFAVHAEDTKKTIITSFARVNTGNAIPEGFNAVLMVEDAEFTGDHPTEIRPAIELIPGDNVRPVGEDIFAGHIILPKGAVIRPLDIGSIAAYGITEVKVRSLTIGILPTGTELVSPGTVPKPGQLVESNSIMCAAYLREFGADVICYPPVIDDKELIRQAVQKALLECDLLLISAGSSAGTKDYTSTVLAELGDLKFHGIFLKPGKPVMLSVVSGKPVIGMPGYPISSQTVMRALVSELLASWGYPGPEKAYVDVVLGSTVKSKENLDEYFLYSVGVVNGKTVAIPHSKGSSVQMSGVRANAVIHVPSGCKGYAEGTVVSALLTVPKADIAKTFLIGGIYDTALFPLMEKTAEAGIRIRTGDFVEEEGIRLVQNGYCHAACINKGTPVPDGCIGRMCGSVQLVYKKDLANEFLRLVV